MYYKNKNINYNIFESENIKTVWQTIGNNVDSVKIMNNFT